MSIHKDQLCNPGENIQMKPAESITSKPPITMSKGQTPVPTGEMEED